MVLCRKEVGGRVVMCRKEVGVGGWCWVGKSRGGRVVLGGRVGGGIITLNLLHHVLHL